MKNILFVALATMTCLYACSPKMNSPKTTLINKLSVDADGKPMLIGTCSRASLQEDSFKVWFDKNYSAYQVNDTAVSRIKPLSGDKTFLLFMGTWCGDSKREIPRMFKIFDSCGIPAAKIKLVMLDDRDSMYKQSPQHEEKGLNIHRVPTFIIYEKTKELGRIVESPIVSLEKDLLAILQKEPYRPNYQAISYLDSCFRENDEKKIAENISIIVTSLKPLVKHAGELNTYGYVLMAAKELKKAGIVFELNTRLYPDKANVFDSMGEFYFRAGNYDAAKQYYRKVLNVDPVNENAMDMLQKIENLK